MGGLRTNSQNVGNSVFKTYHNAKYLPGKAFSVDDTTILANTFMGELKVLPGGDVPFWEYEISSNIDYYPIDVQTHPIDEISTFAAMISPNVPYIYYGILSLDKNTRKWGAFWSTYNAEIGTIYGCKIVGTTTNKLGQSSIVVVLKGASGIVFHKVAVVHNETTGWHVNGIVINGREANASDAFTSERYEASNNTSFINTGVSFDAVMMPGTENIMVITWHGGYRSYTNPWNTGSDESNGKAYIKIYDLLNAKNVTEWIPVPSGHLYFSATLVAIDSITSLLVLGGQDRSEFILVSYNGGSGINFGTSVLSRAYSDAYTMAEIDQFYGDVGTGVLLDNPPNMKIKHVFFSQFILMPYINSEERGWRGTIDHIVSINGSGKFAKITEIKYMDKLHDVLKNGVASIGRSFVSKTKTTFFNETSRPSAINHLFLLSPGIIGSTSTKAVVYAYGVYSFNTPLIDKSLRYSSDTLFLTGQSLIGLNGGNEGSGIDAANALGTSWFIGIVTNSSGSRELRFSENDCRTFMPIKRIRNHAIASGYWLKTVFAIAPEDLKNVAPCEFLTEGEIETVLVKGG